MIWSSHYKKPQYILDAEITPADQISKTSVALHHAPFVCSLECSKWIHITKFLWDFHPLTTLRSFLEPQTGPKMCFVVPRCGAVVQPGDGASIAHVLRLHLHGSVHAWKSVWIDVRLQRRWGRPQAAFNRAMAGFLAGGMSHQLLLKLLGLMIVLDFPLVVQVAVPQKKGWSLV